MSLCGDTNERLLRPLKDALSTAGQHDIEEEFYLNMQKERDLLLADALDIIVKLRTRIITSKNASLGPPRRGHTPPYDDKEDENEDRDLPE